MKDVVHIRDIMMTDRKLKEIAFVTLCGEVDNKKKGHYGAPDWVILTCKNPCPKCVRIWKAEADSQSPQIRAKHKFRKKMHLFVQRNFSGMINK